MDIDNLTAKDLSNLHINQLDELSVLFDEKNKMAIDDAYNMGIIDETTRDNMFDLYGNSMELYRNVYRAMYETFGSPVYTTAFDFATGEEDRNDKGKVIDYTLRILSPYVTSKVKFLDKNNNAINIIFPKMKSVRRSVEKIEKEISNDYVSAQRNAINQYFQDEDRDALVERLQSIPDSCNQLQDVCRLTITCKYLSDVFRIKRKLTEQGKKGKNRFYYINDEETRDSFNKPLSENKKGYFDIKMYMHVQVADDKFYTVEMQLKPDTIFHGHMRDHVLYEKLREIQGQLSPTAPASEKKAQGQLIQYYTKAINEIRTNNNQEYNMMVLDKAFRIEDTDYRPLRIPPDNKNGTYDKCRSFIAENYLVTSYKPFYAEKSFSPDSIDNKKYFLKIIGYLPKDFDEFSDHAADDIDKKFGELEHAERRRFYGICALAKRYEYVIRDTINTRKAVDITKLKEKQSDSEIGAHSKSDWLGSMRPIQTPSTIISQYKSSEKDR